MFDRELKSLGIPAKVLITFFLLVIGTGYLSAVYAIYETHRLADGKEPLTMGDIVLTYYGDRETTLLGSKSLGTMKTYYESDDDIDKVLNWIKSGADRIAYEKTVAPIFTKSCVSCHSSRGSESGSPLTTFEEVVKYAEVNKGVAFARLSTLSHTHLITHSLMFFLLSLIFLMSSVKDRWKTLLFILSFGAIFCDVACWWLSKLSPVFSYGTVIFGSVLGITFLFYFFRPLYEMWLKKK
ncbi:MAG: hypothetical protein JW984_05415 [Deltaproteobacteria bacterium]|uniref:Elongation factor-1 alpha n=1 Tax=Candidatus Zymogenus saltonus TaxID=2844893 RepID=A0A9D8KC45_9DELT|nr:hypothetical protein [Candidatus Zymogenus saltonus]